MANTLVLLERITVGAAGASSVVFSNIPQTGYTDLVVKISARSTRASQIVDNLLIQVNGSASGFTYKNLSGTGSAAGSASYSSGYLSLAIPASGATANTFSNIETYIPNYTSSNYKSFSTDATGENNASNSQIDLNALLWSNTAAITSLTAILSDTGSSFVNNSTFSLYGVSAVGTIPTKAPKAIGGSIIETDGTYWYHAFLSSGTFTPATGLSCDILVVAGGGGASSHQGGGGGAGGVLAFASQTLTANTSYTATVGAGGTGASDVATSGGNSQFGSLTAAVGGGAGGLLGANGTAGGSGGGAGASNVSVFTGGAGTSGQGNAGGSGATVWYGGGGGGAGATGGNATSPNAGNGGAGVNTVTNWGALSTVLSTTGLGVSGYIAGGGGGGSNSATSGTGGSGGGGAGSTGTGTAGTANTGSGAGGGGNGGSGSNGGSGLIIVRYAV